MTDQRVSKVEGKHISTSSVLSDTKGGATSGNEAARMTIDPGVLELLKGLPPSDEAESFEDRVAHFADRLGSNLKSVRSTLVARDHTKLETLAFELSTNALMVGAVRILSSSYELQNAARLGDWAMAEALADQLDVEFLMAKDGLKEAAALK